MKSEFRVLSVKAGETELALVDHAMEVSGFTVSQLLKLGIRLASAELLQIQPAQPKEHQTDA